MAAVWESKAQYSQGFRFLFPFSRVFRHRCSARCVSSRTRSWPSLQGTSVPVLPRRTVTFIPAPGDRAGPGRTGVWAGGAGGHRDPGAPLPGAAEPLRPGQAGIGEEAAAGRATPRWRGAGDAAVQGPGPSPGGGARGCSWEETFAPDPTPSAARLALGSRLLFLFQHYLTE